MHPEVKVKRSECAGDLSAQIWQPPRGEMKLREKEINVWRVELGQSNSDRDRFFRTLSPDEKLRASKFHFRRDSEHFIGARGALRAILGGYLDLRPDALSFGYNNYGKPFLIGEGSDALKFNLSHSHGLALLAVTPRRELGIDIERMRPEVIDEQIAEHFFSVKEVEALRRLPRRLQVDGFFNCWVRKEAYIKARGEGLSLALDAFAVSLVPGEPAALLQSEAGVNEPSRWMVFELNPGRGFKAALVAEREDWRIRCFQWPLSGAGLS